MRAQLVILLLVTTACGRFGFGADTPVDGRRANDAPIDAVSPISLVQQVTATTDSGTSLAATLPAPPRAGDLLVMIGAIQSGPLTAVTGAGTTWTFASAEDTNTNVEVWYGVTDGSSATVQITGAATSELWISLQEWRGVDMTNPLDASAAMFGGTSPASAGTIVTGGPEDLVIFTVADVIPNSFGAPTGGAWIPLDATQTVSYVEQPWYMVGSAPSTFAPDVTETGGHWGAVLAAFRGAP